MAGVSPAYPVVAQSAQIAVAPYPFPAESPSAASANASSSRHDVTQPNIIIGVDESGRGALAGPLTVCAAAFRREDSPITASYQDKRGVFKTLIVKDSKKIANPEHRDTLAAAIKGAALGVAVVERSAAEIDQRLMFKVFPETLRLAVVRLLEQLVAKGHPREPEHYLVVFDGEVPMPRDLRCPMRAIVDGDARVWQIGAASIVAKAARDEVMAKLHAKHPNYGFDKHKGYPTKDHKALLKQLGASDVHRKTFRPVAEAQGLPPGFEE